MARGRPPKGPDIVDGFDGSEHAKRRLKIILETITGDLDIPEACEALGISKTSFHKLRSRLLENAIDDLEPKLAGRPVQMPSPEEKRIAELEDELTETRMQFVGSQIREEIALAMPHLLSDKKKDVKKPKKRNKKRKKRCRKRPQGGSGSGNPSSREG